MLDIKIATGKARCQACGDIIYKGETDILGRIGGGYYTGHYHLNCFLSRHAKDMIKILKLSGNILLDKIDVEDILTDLLEYKPTEEIVKEALDFVNNDDTLADTLADVLRAFVKKIPLKEYDEAWVTIF